MRQVGAGKGATGAARGMVASGDGPWAAAAGAAAAGAAAAAAVREGGIAGVGAVGGATAVLGG